MRLAVKIGNSRISIGGFEGDCGNLVFSASIETRKKATAYEYANSFTQILSLHHVSRQQLEGGIICSVVPLLTTEMKKALQLICRGSVLIVSSGTKTGLNIRKHNGNLGADFVCMAVAAVRQYPLPGIVVSLGTATTFSAIDREGCFLGTSITAGIQTALTALWEYTAKLSEIEIEPPSEKRIYGTTTADSMKSGLIYGTASLVDGMCRRYQRELGEQSSIIITGEYAEVILPYCETDYYYDKDLLLRGMDFIYCKNIAKNG